MKTSDAGPRQTLVDAICHIRNIAGTLTTTGDYVHELETRCEALNAQLSERGKLIEELAGVNASLIALLRERGVQLRVGPVAEGKATWTFTEDGGNRDAADGAARAQSQDPQNQAPCLNLYLVTPLDPDFGDYDTYDSFIAAAASIEEARAMHPSDGSQLDTDRWGHGNAGRGTWVNRADETKAELIGMAEAGVKAGVVLASYNAG